eukprot:12695254-Alexandrium_andersonii.AAC.1
MLKILAYGCSVHVNAALALPAAHSSAEVLPYVDARVKGTGAFVRGHLWVCVGAVRDHAAL